MSFFCSILMKRLSVIQKEENQQYFSFLPQSTQTPRGEANISPEVIQCFLTLRILIHFLMQDTLSNKNTDPFSQRWSRWALYTHLFVFAYVHLTLLKGTDSKTAVRVEQVCVVLGE